MPCRVRERPIGNPKQRRTDKCEKEFGRPRIERFNDVQRGRKGQDEVCFSAMRLGGTPKKQKGEIREKYLTIIQTARIFQELSSELK